MKNSILLLSFIFISISLQAQSLMVSQDLGSSWVKSDIIPSDAQVNFIRPFQDKLLIGTENQGLFLNARCISDLLPGKKVNSLLVEGESIYVSIYHEGLFKSTNSGFSWEKLSGEEVRGLFFLEGKLVVGSDDGISIYSQGEWTKVFEGQQVVSIDGSGEHLIAGASKGLLLSRDSGLSWEWIHQNGAVHNLVLSNDIIYSLNISGDLMTSNDWGVNWITEEYEYDSASEIYDLLQIKDRKLMSNSKGVLVQEAGSSEWKFVHKTEKFVYYDLQEVGDQIYAGTRPK